MPVAPQPGRTAQLCILALPADMGFAELCAFMGAYFQHVSALNSHVQPLAQRLATETAAAPAE